MLYPKNQAEQLSRELFREPTSEYRGAPFWAWNCELDAKELCRQLEILKKMGFGGAHMHVRSGMATPYLSPEYMELIRTCVEKAKSEKMRAYLYDEDRWPSGAAGGLVTKDKKYRARYLLFTPFPYTVDKSGADTVEGSTAAAGRTENGVLLARYDVELTPEGTLLSSRLLAEGEKPLHDCWYAYLEQPQETGWYNNQTYVNTLDKASMDRFIEITYESYNRTIPEDFGDAVPSIFTDEPQFTRKSTLRFGTDRADVTLPWTDDLPDTFRAVYGENLMEGIPQLIWDKADGSPSLLRYHYHDHICERFASAFADNCGAWCRAHGLALTGHMMSEPTLESQTGALGEAMRSYRGFDIPGIDMLCAYFEYTTAKQTQSAVHQFGREGMLSELYGVTNWDFDFRGHKLHGDWQAALGVTLRVPHLSWVSMAGEAKRDYPASINYQSPWWTEYPMVEDHFARVNTALTRGKPVVKIGMIHPVESYWLHWGPAEQTALVREELDQNFQDCTQWLLFGGLDFDYISESLLPSLCEKGGAPLTVGEMSYDAILVPGCETLRSSTLERLEAFVAAGGKLIFAGALPNLVDALPSDRAKKLAEKASVVPLSRGALLEALQSCRQVELRNETGSLTTNLLTQLRRDGENQWLFIAHGKEPYNKDVSLSQTLRIRVRGHFRGELWDTLSGEVSPIASSIVGDFTQFSYQLYDYDSLLLKLIPWEESIPATASPRMEISPLSLPLPVRCAYSLDEPNALLLDQAEWALDDAPWQPSEEILRLDNSCREILGWPSRKESFAQPWVVPAEPPRHAVRLRWHIFSDIAITGVSLGMEDVEGVTLTWNGEAVPSTVTGWYTDKSIRTVSLPPVRRGENILTAVIPFGRRSNLEWAYLLGSFGVEAHGRSVKLTALPETLAFGDITSQGLPFYGGNVTYHIPVCTTGRSLKITSPQYRGSLQSVSLDEGEKIPCVYPPYQATFPEVAPGEHILHLTLWGHRRNSFGPVHLTDLCQRWIGPNAWRSEGETWSYDYHLCEEGILSTPVLEEV